MALLDVLLFAAIHASIGFPLVAFFLKKSNSPINFLLGLLFTQTPF